MNYESPRPGKRLEYIVSQVPSKGYNTVCIFTGRVKDLYYHCIALDLFHFSGIPLDMFSELSTQLSNIYVLPNKVVSQNIHHWKI